EATAVLVGRREVSYGELDRWADRIAHQLLALGARPGELIAVLLDRAVEMIPALLAILKAGGTYVPLEPSWPAARVHWILSSFAIRHVLTQADKVPDLAALEPLPWLSGVLCLDRKSAAQRVHGATVQGPAAPGTLPAGNPALDTPPE